MPIGIHRENIVVNPHTHFYILPDVFSVLGFLPLRMFNTRYFSVFEPELFFFEGFQASNAVTQHFVLIIPFKCKSSFSDHLNTSPPYSDSPIYPSSESTS